MRSPQRCLANRRVSVATWSLRLRPVCRRAPASPTRSMSARSTAMWMSSSFTSKANSPASMSRLDAVEAGRDGVGVLLRDDALRRQHARMRLGAGDVLRVERLVHRQRRAEALRERVRSLGEPARPQCHGALPSAVRDGFGLGSATCCQMGVTSSYLPRLSGTRLLLGVEQLGRGALPAGGWQPTSCRRACAAV